MADQRLYKLVKWCKSLPLFKNIMVSPGTGKKVTELMIVLFRLTTKYLC